MYHVHLVGNSILLPEIAGLDRLAAYPVFSQENFDLLTLGDVALQRQLIEAFLRHSAQSRDDLLKAARSGSEPFAEAIHRLKGSCHFTAGDRLLRLLNVISDRTKMKRQKYRIAAAQAILEGLDQLEEALSAVLAQIPGMANTSI